jgi:hypothetical protein
MKGISNLKLKLNSDCRLNSCGSLRLTPHYCTGACTYLHTYEASVLNQINNSREAALYWSTRRMFCRFLVLRTMLHASGVSNLLFSSFRPLSCSRRGRPELRPVTCPDGADGGGREHFYQGHFECMRGGPSFRAHAACLPGTISVLEGRLSFLVQGACSQGIIKSFSASCIL